MKRFISLLIFLLCGMFSISQSQPKEGIHFVHLTDLHVSVGNDNDLLLQDIVNDINQGKNEFVVITGDLTNFGNDDELERVYDILSDLKIPYYVVSGNHETTWSKSAGQTFKRLWGEDRFIFTKGDYVFVGFPCGPYMKMGDGFVKKENLILMEKMLRDSLTDTHKKVLTFSHYPLDNSVSNYKEVLGVLQQFPTVAAFCGHGHTLKNYDFSGLSGIMGTSIITRDGKTQSYNEVVIGNDSIRVYRKKVKESRDFNFAVSTQPATITFKKDKFDSDYSPLIRDSASIYGLPTFDKSSLYFANSLGEIKAVNLKNNSIKWNHKNEHSIYFSPVLVNGNLIVGTIDGKIKALDKNTGKQKWQKDIGGISVGMPIVENDIIYTGSSEAFVAIDGRDGTILWKNGLPSSYTQAQPLIHGDKIIFGAWDTHLYCLDKSTGNLIWKWNNDGNPQLLFSPGNVKVVASQKRLYFVTPQRKLTILDIENGTTLLQTSQWKIRESMGASADGKWFYGKTMDGELLRLPLNDDLVLTEENLIANSKVLDLGLGYEHNPAPIIENNYKIYIGSRKGEVVIIDAQTFEVLKTIKLGNSSINGFVEDRQGSIWTVLIEGSIFKLHEN